MPPKRKATGAGRGGKKAKTARQMVDALKKAGDDRKKAAKVDSYCYQFASNGRVSFAEVIVRFRVKVQSRTQVGL